MNRILAGASFCFAMLIAACSASYTSGWAANAQTVVDGVAKSNADCVRLSVHCTPENASASINCACTAREKVGKPSDAEDLKAMQTGEPVVIEQQGALDVTVPILAKDGKFTAACGVTLKNAGASREQLVGKAKTIAAEVEKGLRGSGGCCGSAGGSCCGGDGGCCSDKK